MGVIAVMSGTKMKQLQVLIVGPNHLNFGIKLLQHVTLLKFTVFFRICDDVTWQTSVGLS